MNFLLLIIFIALNPTTKAFAEKITSHKVIMKSISFDPKILEIQQNQFVEWTNKSYSDHSATAEDKKSFDTGFVGPGKSSQQIQFKELGIFNYHCSIHGQTMSARIVVVPAKVQP